MLTVRTDDGADIFFQARGGGPRAILFMHGRVASSPSWDSLLGHLDLSDLSSRGAHADAGRRRRVRPDLQPGSSASGGRRPAPGVRLAQHDCSHGIQSEMPRELAALIVAPLVGLGNTHD